MNKLGPGNEKKKQFSHLRGDSLCSSLFGIHQFMVSPGLAWANLHLFLKGWKAGLKGAVAVSCPQRGEHSSGPASARPVPSLGAQPAQPGAQRSRGPSARAPSRPPLFPLPTSLYPLVPSPGARHSVDGQGNLVQTLATPLPPTRRSSCPFSGSYRNPIRTS